MPNSANKYTSIFEVFENELADSTPGVKCPLNWTNKVITVPH